jgi:hypothetical protein
MSISCLILKKNIIEIAKTFSINKNSFGIASTDNLWRKLRVYILENNALKRA